MSVQQSQCGDPIAHSNPLTLVSFGEGCVWDIQSGEEQFYRDSSLDS